MEVTYNAKELVKDLLRIKAVSLSPNKPYTWASGLKSPIYTDNRLTVAYPEIRQNIAKLLGKKIQENFPDATVIGGVATAGIPHATSVSNVLNLPLSYIRPKPKKHGRGRQTEGRCEPGDKLVLIDDLISTGGSILEAAKAAEKEGMEICGTASIFSYGLPQADANFKNAGIQLVSLVTFSELIEISEDLGYINDQELQLLKDWYKNPEEWGT